MTPRSIVAGGLLTVWLAATAVSAPTPPAAKSWKPPVVAAPAPVPGAAVSALQTARSYLPDTVVLATVQGRSIRVNEFVDRYFNSWVPTRPDPDSAGRVEFLNSMVNKEIMAYVAREAKRAEIYRIVDRYYLARADATNPMIRKGGEMKHDMKEMKGLEHSPTTHTH